MDKKYILGIALLFAGWLLSYGCPLNKKGVDRVCAWLKRQVAPSLAAVVAAFGGSVDFIYDLLSSGSGRLSEKHRNMIQTYWGVQPAGVMV